MTYTHVTMTSCGIKLCNYLTHDFSLLDYLISIAHKRYSNIKIR
jgi:hypothetical protein